MKKALITYLMFVLVGSLLFAQTNEQIKKENSRLECLKKSIDKLEERISKNKKKEKSSLEVLDDIDQQILLLNKYINELSREERRTGKRISVLTKKIRINESEIEKLQKNFAKLIKWYYKFGNQSELDMLFGSGDMNDAVTKMRYVKIISGETKNTIEELRDKRAKLKRSKAQLVREKKEQHKLLTAKQKEKRTLLAAKEEKKKLIARLRKNNSSLISELKNKRAAEEKIRLKIAELIKLENERLAKKNESKSDLKEFAAYDLSDFENFNELRGRLNWPVNKGKITRGFGKQRNTRLNTVTLNYGVDIKTESNAKVRAVAGGVISIIDWIPGYGSVLIITHKNGYRTVYGHLTDISVTQGDKVNAGVELGRVSESLEGNILHFEIWKQRENQNPIKWLARK